jgi:competence protein ComEC
MPVEAAGRLEVIPGPLNPGEFDRRAYLRGQGIRLRLVVSDPHGVWLDREGSVSWPLRCLGAVRSWSQRQLDRGMRTEIAPLATALLLGRREGVQPDINDAFARTGTTHVLAISGLHLQVLAMVLGLVLLTLGLGRRSTSVVVALATVAYALLVGLMPSVVRSAAMTVIFCLAVLCYRAPSPANTLALAALVTLGINPANLFDAGCQLSFLAVAAIFWGVEPIRWWLRLAPDTLLEWVRGRPRSPLDDLERKFEPRGKKLIRRGIYFLETSTVLSVVIWLAALPLVALRFHIVSPIAILLNLPLIPLTSAALLMAGLSLLLAAIWRPLGAPPGWLCGVLLNWSEGLVRWGSAQRWGYTFVAGPSWIWVVGLYALLGIGIVAVTGLWGWRWRRWAGWSLAGWIGWGCVTGLGPHRPGSVDAEVLAVGHGLAVVIQDGEGRTIVYDCGRMRDPGVGRRVIAPALWARGVRRIDKVILSHADADHFNGLSDLLDRFDIEEVRVAPGFEASGERNPEAARLLAELRARRVPVLPIAAGDTWDLAGARLSVRHPARQWRPVSLTDDNARSVVLDLESNGRHVLLTGDLEHDGLVRLVQEHEAPEAVDVLLAPHHGSRVSNPVWFYEWARPAQVVVSQRAPMAGAADPLALLRAERVKLLRTWERGAVRLAATENGWTAQGFLDPPNVGRLLQETPQRAALLAISWDRARFAFWWPRGVVMIVGFLAGILIVGVLAVREWGAWTLVAPQRSILRALADPGSSNPDDGLTPGELIGVVARDGVRLAGIWYPVAGPPVFEGTRAVVFVHGWGESPTALQGRTEAMRRHGWSVAVLDPRGYGQSGGEHGTFGGREADDLQVWLDLLSERVGLSGTLTAWGRSMGAAIVVRAAADDHRLRAIVLESPYGDLEAATVAMLRKLRLPAAHWLARVIMGRAETLAGVSLTRPRPFEIVPRIAAPTLIVHGADDWLVPLADARRLADAFPKPAAIIEVPGARHSNVIDVGGPTLLDQIAAFLDGAVSQTAIRSERC